jgi:hypothetical protein
MFSKLSFSIIAALLLSATGGAVRAASLPGDAAFSAAESGNPDSTEYSTRMHSRHSPSNEEINAAEIGNPDSVDNRNQMVRSTSGNWQEAWQAVEFGNPDFR